VCEASCGRGFKKSSPTAIHHTSLFQYCLDTYKGHGGHDKVGQYSKNSLRKYKDSTKGSTSSTANICLYVIHMKGVTLSVRLLVIEVSLFIVSLYWQ
jgi:hypothetical protein